MKNSFEQYIDTYLQKQRDCLITEAMSYAMEGGKRFRPRIVFAILRIIMLLWSVLSPRREGAWIQQDVGAVNLTPWRYAVPVGIVLLILVFLNYAVFADFSVLWK